MNTYISQKGHKKILSFIIFAFVAMVPVSVNAATLYIDVNKTNTPGAATPRNYTTYAPPGSPITIDWDMLTIYESSTNCYASWSPSYGISGSGTVYPTVDTSYRLYCMFPYATSAAFYDINIIFGTVAPAPTATLFTNTPTIPPGGTAILTYTCTDSTSATISGIGAVNPTSGAVSVSPSTTTTYTLTCTGNGTATDVKTVTVNALPVATLVANNPTITNGGSSLLTYSCTNSPTSAMIDNGVGTQTPASGGNVSVSPSTTTTYKLTCTNASGSTTASATVTVYPVLTASCSVSPASIAAGSSATWTAVPSGGTGVYTYSWSGTDGLTGSGSSVVFPYATPGPKTASVTVTSGTQSITQACSNSLTVNPAAQPDVTVSVAPSGSAGVTVGSNTTYTGSINNTGTAIATGVPNVLQILDSTGTTNIARVAASPATINIPVNTPQAVSASYAFLSAGTYQIRFCGNMNTAGTQVISESSFGNNCGPMTQVTVSAAGPATTACTVSQTSLPSTGGSVTYSANPSASVSAPYTWTPSDGVGSYGSGVTATRVFTSANAGNSYGMSVTGTPASLSNCPSVSVGSSCSGTPSGTVSATPNRIKANTPTSVTFNLSSIQNVVTSCVLTGPSVSRTFSPNSCTVAGTNYSQTLTLATQGVYTLTCDGVKTASAIVNVIPAVIEF